MLLVEAFRALSLAIHGSALFSCLFILLLRLAKSVVARVSRVGDVSVQQRNSPIEDPETRNNTAAQQQNAPGAGHDGEKYVSGSSYGTIILTAGIVHEIRFGVIIAARERQLAYDHNSGVMPAAALRFPSPSPALLRRLQRLLRALCVITLGCGLAAAGLAPSEDPPARFTPTGPVGVASAALCFVAALCYAGAAWVARRVTPERFDVKAAEDGAEARRPELPLRQSVVSTLPISCLLLLVSALHLAACVAAASLEEASAGKHQQGLASLLAISVFVSWLSVITLTTSYAHRMGHERKDGRGIARPASLEEEEAALRDDASWELDPVHLNFRSGTVENVWRNRRVTESARLFAVGYLGIAACTSGLLTYVTWLRPPVLAPGVASAAFLALRGGAVFTPLHLTLLGISAATAFLALSLALPCSVRLLGVSLVYNMLLGTMMLGMVMFGCVLLVTYAEPNSAGGLLVFASLQSFVSQEGWSPLTAKQATQAYYSWAIAAVFISHEGLFAGRIQLSVSVVVSFLVGSLWCPYWMRKHEIFERQLFALTFKSVVLRERVNAFLAPTPAERAAVAAAFGPVTEEGDQLLGNFRVPADAVELYHLLASGASGEAWVAAIRSMPGVQICVKRMHRHRLQSERVRRFKDEIIMCSRVSHPSVVEFLGFTLEPPKLYLCLEYCERGDLLNVLRTPPEVLGQRLTWVDPLARMMTEAAMALAHIHAMGYMWRDVKARNVLVTSAFEVRLTDMGEALLARSSSEPVGTIGFMAPEVIRGDEYTNACDAYGFGCLLFECATGGKAPQQPPAGSAGGPLAFPPGTPSAILSLATRMLSLDPSSRPRMDVAVEALAAFSSAEEEAAVEELAHAGAAEARKPTMLAQASALGETAAIIMASHAVLSRERSSQSQRSSHQVHMSSVAPAAPDRRLSARPREERLLPGSVLHPLTLHFRSGETEQTYADIIRVFRLRNLGRWSLAMGCAAVINIVDVALFPTEWTPRMPTLTYAATACLLVCCALGLALSAASRGRGRAAHLAAAAFGDASLLIFGVVVAACWGAATSMVQWLNGGVQLLIALVLFKSRRVSPFEFLQSAAVLFAACAAHLATCFSVLPPAFRAAIALGNATAAAAAVAVAPAGVVTSPELLGPWPQQWVGTRAFIVAWIVWIGGASLAVVYGDEKHHREAFLAHTDHDALKRKETLMLQPTTAEVAVVKAARLEEDPSLLRWRVSLQAVVLSRELGRGAFGVVYRGLLNGSPCAVKMMSRSAFNEDQMARFIHEILLIGSIHHPNVVRFLGCAWEAPNVMLIVELCDRGAVEALLRNRSIALDWASPCMGIAIDVAKALVYLHAQSPPTIHRDVKTLNVLLTATSRAKLSDFGESRTLTTETMTRVGTFNWSSPEMLSGDVYDERTDVYSFGMLLFELAERTFPFAGARGNIVSMVLRGERPLFHATAEGYTTGDDVEDRVARGVASIAARCWAPKTADRPAMKEVLTSLQSLKQSAGGLRRMASSLGDSSGLSRSRRGSCSLKSAAAAEAKTVAAANEALGTVAQ